MNDELNNAYVDSIIGHLHRTLQSMFQLEANYKLLEKELNDKSNLIGQYEQQFKTVIVANEDLAAKNKALEDNLNSSATVLNEEKNSLAHQLDILNVENERFYHDYKKIVKELEDCEKEKILAQNLCDSQKLMVFNLNEQLRVVKEELEELKKKKVLTPLKPKSINTNVKHSNKTEKSA